MYTVGLGVIIGRIVLIAVLFLVIPIGTILLQIYLSKREELWLGLILPTIPFVLSLIVVFSMAAYVGSGTMVVQTDVTDAVSGEVVTTTIVTEQGGIRAMPGAVAGVIYTFVLINIPTAILLIIYKVVRGKNKQRREVEKMSVHDLG